MAKLYADSAGNLLRLAQAEFEFSMGAPSGAAFTRDFDPSTNAALLADLLAHWLLYSMPNGTLEKSGVAVTVTVPSADYAIDQKMAQVASALANGQFQGATVTLSQAQSDFTAIEAGTATLLQVQRFLVFLGNFVGRTDKALLASGTL